MTLLSPVPYFGGKSKVADIVWQRFGNVDNYIEPFFGSGAVLLRRPDSHNWQKQTETINDLDGFVANFWRALQADPDAVAHYADWPTNENDLHARHAWLVGQKTSMQSKLEGDPDYFDAKIAGWWCWGMCEWIGSGFCSGRGPWIVKDGQLVHLSNDGQGINRQLVHLGNDGRGINRQLVHLGDDGRGDGLCETVSNNIRDYVRTLADRMRRVRVCCGDWTRICGETPLMLNSASSIGVFLDPPYSKDANRDMTLYRIEDSEVAFRVREWAIEMGKIDKVRIAYCGYDEMSFPPDWEVYHWKASGGYSGQGDGTNLNKEREVIWFSPSCNKAEKQLNLLSD
jgi:DNA adenine methylase